MKFIIFDWDGTIVDSVGKITACAQWTCRDLGVDVPSAEAVRDLIGLDLHSFMRQMASSFSSTVHQALADGYRDRWRSGQLSESELFPKTREMLADLRQKGFQLAVATGKSRAGLNRELEVHGLNDQFELTRCADETKAKPHPQMLFDLLVEGQIDASQTLMIGDTEMDMEMAQRAGVARFGVTSGCHDESRLSKWKPVECAPYAHHVVDWLAALQS